MLRYLLSAIFPQGCHLCHRRLCDGVLCSRCKPEVTSKPGVHCWRCATAAVLSVDGLCEWCAQAKLPWQKLIRLWDYHGLARELVVAAKYRPDPSLLFELGTMLALQAQQNANTNYAHIVPAPTRSAALQRRGFNHAALLAHQIAQVLGCAHADILTSSERGIAQAKRSFRARQRRIRTLISVAPLRKPLGRVLVIDDVLTSGATAYAAAQALLEAGASHVDLAVLCCSARWHRERRWLERLALPPEERSAERIEVFNK